MAINKNTSDTRDLKVGQEQSHEIPMTGHVDRSAFQDEFETVDTPDYDEVAKRTAFFEELVEVKVLEDQRPNAEQFIQTSVNGINQFFERGVPVFVKRMFLEVLARARPFNITTQEYVDSNGSKATKIVKSFGLAYPFAVLADNNPDGRRWLEAILKEA